MRDNSNDDDVDDGDDEQCRKADRQTDELDKTESANKHIYYDGTAHASTRFTCTSFTCAQPATSDYSDSLCSIGLVGQFGRAGRSRSHKGE